MIWFLARLKRVTPYLLLALVFTPEEYLREASLGGAILILLSAALTWLQWRAGLQIVARASSGPITLAEDERHVFGLKATSTSRVENNGIEFEAHLIAAASILISFFGRIIICLWALVPFWVPGLRIAAALVFIEELAFSIAVKRGWL